MKTVPRPGCHTWVEHRRQRRKRGMVLRRPHSCQTTTMSYGAAGPPGRSRIRRRRCPPPDRAAPASGPARRSATVRSRDRMRRGRESHARHCASNLRRRAGRARHTRSRALICHRSTLAAGSCSARGKQRRPARPQHRTRSAPDDGPSGAENAKVLLEKEKTAPRACSLKMMTTAESTNDVKEKRRYSLTSVTTVGRCNKTTQRASVADVTRLTLRSHKGGCYSSADSKGAFSRLRNCQGVFTKLID